MVSPTSYQGITKGLSEDYQGITEGLPRDYQGITKRSPRDYRGIAEGLPRDYQGITKVSLRDHGGNHVTCVIVFDTAIFHDSWAGGDAGVQILVEVQEGRRCRHRPYRRSGVSAKLGVPLRSAA